MYKRSFLLFTILFLAINIRGDSKFNIKEFIEIHGFVSQGFFASKGNTFLSQTAREGSFEYRNIGINFQKEIGSRLRMGIQLLCRDMGTFGNNKLLIDWAYGNFLVHDVFSISAGRMKNQLGFYSDVQDIDFLVPWASLPYYVYDKGLRTITSSTDGFKVFGNVKLGLAGDLDYSFTIGTTDVGKDSDIMEYGRTIKETFTKTSVSNIHIPQIKYNSPIEGLSINFAYYQANDFKYTVPNKNVSGFNVDVDISQNIRWFYTGIQYQHYLFDIIAEYHHQFMDGTQNITALNITSPDTTRRVGGYFGYNIKPLDWFNTSGYLQLHWRDIFNLDKQKDPHEPHKVQHDIAITTAFIIKSNLVIKLEGHQVYGTALLSSDLNEGNKLTDWSDWWQYGIIKLSYNF